MVPEYVPSRYSPGKKDAPGRTALLSRPAAVGAGGRLGRAVRRRTKLATCSKSIMAVGWLLRSSRPTSPGSSIPRSLLPALPASDDSWETIGPGRMIERSPRGGLAQPHRSTGCSEGVRLTRRVLSAVGSLAGRGPAAGWLVHRIRQPAGPGSVPAKAARSLGTERSGAVAPRKLSRSLLHRSRSLPIRLVSWLVWGQGPVRVARLNPGPACRGVQPPLPGYLFFVRWPDFLTLSYLLRSPARVTRRGRHRRVRFLGGPAHSARSEGMVRL
jgi:hypothetical protein